MPKFKIQRILAFAFIIASWGKIYGQEELKFDVIDQTKGLSVNTVSALIQDSRGFIWIGTRDGLNLYDGVKFQRLDFSEHNSEISSLHETSDGKIWIGIVGLGLVEYDPITYAVQIFQHIDSDENSVSDHDIVFIHEDQSGVIWLLSKSHGIQSFERSEVEFTTYYPTNPLIPATNSSEIVEFHEDGKGNIWIGTSNGTLNLFNKETQNFEYIPLNSGTNNNPIQIIYSDRAGSLWVGSKQHLNHLNIDLPSTEIGESVRFDLPDISSIWQDNGRQIWISSGSKLLKYNRDIRQFELEKNLESRVMPTIVNRSSTFTGNHVSKISVKGGSTLVDNDGNFWMLTNKGLDFYDPSTGFYRQIRNDDDFSNISNNQIVSSLMDEAGSLWFGSIGGGVNKFVNPKFLHYQYKKGVDFTLGGPMVLSFFENLDSNIWVGTNGGIFSLLDPESGRFKRYAIPESNSVIFDIEQDNNDVWLATSGDGLVKFNTMLGTFNKYLIGFLGGESVQRLHVDEVRGIIWVGTNGGLYQFNRTTEEFTRINLDEILGVAPNVFALFEDVTGEIWLGSIGQGLIHLNVDDPNKSVIYSTKSSAHSINNNFITSIHKDSKNESVLWCATYGAGLFKLNRSDNKIEHFGMESGMLNTVIYGLVEDEAGALWFSSNAGISKFDKSLGKVTDHYDVSDGLQSNEFNRGAYIKSSKGDLYFGGVNGFNVFDPSTIVSQSFDPKVFITTIRVNNQRDSVRESLINNGENQISLNYDQNYLALEFASLDYRNSNGIEYRYRLVGLESRWTNMDNSNPLASYANLAPGAYTFELLATNSDGVWLKEPLSLNITIAPPFWLTIWFRATSIMAILAFAISIHLYRLRNLTKQRERLNKLVEEKTAIIYGQNKEVSEKNLVLEKNASDLQEANQEIILRNDELNTALKELEKTQEQLIESEKMASLGVLSAGMGHEINNPLNFIKGAIELINNHLDKNNFDTDNTITEYLDLASIGVSRATNIVQSLGHFSRKGEQNNEECNPNLILDHCCTILQSKMKRLQIHKNYVEGAKIMGNEGRLHQAFLNILSNAEKAIRAEGEISISTGLTEQHVSVVIQDTGEGIPQKNMKRIMEPFFTTREPGEGTGLGLSITYNIIKEHGGTIRFNSTTNEGTKATITLPLA